MTDANEPIHPDKNYGNIGGTGLTKREYFAGQALATIESSGRSPEFVAKRAVSIADALIAVLNLASSD